MTRIRYTEKLVICYRSLSRPLVSLLTPWPSADVPQTLFSRSAKGRSGSVS